MDGPSESKQTVSTPFRKMAEQIEHNAGAGFGGACVIVPPANGGEPIELLMLDPKGDIAQFYATIQSRITVLLQKLEDQQRVAQGYGMR